MRWTVVVFSVLVVGQAAPEGGCSGSGSGGCSGSSVEVDSGIVVDTCVCEHLCTCLNVPFNAYPGQTEAQYDCADRCPNLVCEDKFDGRGFLCEINPNYDGGMPDAGGCSPECAQGCDPCDQICVQQCSGCIDAGVCETGLHIEIRPLSLNYRPGQHEFEATDGAQLISVAMANQGRSIVRYEWTFFREGDAENASATVECDPPMDSPHYSSACFTFTGSQVEMKDQAKFNFTAGAWRVIVSATDDIERAGESDPLRFVVQ